MYYDHGLRFDVLNSDRFLEVPEFPLLSDSIWKTSSLYLAKSTELIMVFSSIWIMHLKTLNDPDNSTQAKNTLILLNFDIKEMRLQSSSDTDVINREGLLLIGEWSLYSFWIQFGGDLAPNSTWLCH